MHDSGLDDADIAELLDVFLAEAPGQIRAVQKAAAARDAQCLASAAHALKSPAALLCAPRLAEILSGIEEQARDGGIASGHIIDAVEAEVRHVARQTVDD